MLLATLERLTIGLGPLPGWNNGFDGTTTRYAAFSILDKSSLDHAMPSLVTKIGHVVKDATINPLFHSWNKVRTHARTHALSELSEPSGTVVALGNAQRPY